MKMITLMTMLGKIDFVDTNYSNELFESIKQRGIAIPVRVNVVDDRFICVDGHKRLSICKRLSVENEKFNRIPVMILNDFSKSGSSFWGNTQNKH